MGHGGSLRDRGRDRGPCLLHALIFLATYINLSSSRTLLAFTDHAHILAITLFARPSDHRSCLERGSPSTARQTSHRKQRYHQP